MFNGSNGSDTLHTSSTIINTITVRSPTTISFDPITSNPAAGEFLDISGTLTSSNGSGIVDRSGHALHTTLNFAIDGDTNSFSVIGGTVDANGSWSARIFLDLSFPRGTHNITASYTPSVNYYGASSEDGTFDSRGFSMLSIISPADLDPDERVVRGDNITLNMSLIDNSGQFVSGGQIDVSIDGTQSWSGFTDESGILTTSIQTDENRAPGPMTITATFAGFNGSTGLLGDETWTRVVILSPAIIEVTSVTGSAIAGESVTFTGTLLDEHGAPLIENGEDKGGVVHLSIDGISPKGCECGTENVKLTTPCPFVGCSGVSHVSWNNAETDMSESCLSPSLDSTSFAPNGMDVPLSTSVLSRGFLSVNWVTPRTRMVSFPEPVR